MNCPYHNIIHTTIKHNGCVEHGHCLNPTCCPLWQSCPCNAPGYIYKEDPEEAEKWKRYLSGKSKAKCDK